MKGFLKNPNNAQIVRRINREVSQRIPDNIETIMMNVGLWLPQYLSRESRRIQLDYKNMLDKLDNKKSYLIDMKQRLPDPHLPYSSQTNFLQNLVQSFLTSQDTDESEEEQETQPKNQSKSIKMMEIEDKLKEELDKSKGSKGSKGSNKLDVKHSKDKKEPVYELSLDQNTKPYFYSSDEDDGDLN